MIRWRQTERKEQNCTFVKEVMVNNQYVQKTWRKVDWKQANYEWQTKYVKQVQGGVGESVRLTSVCTERPTGAGGSLEERSWGLLIGPARAKQSGRKRGESVSRCGFREEEDGGVVGVNGKGGFPSHMKVCGDECAIIRLISSLIYRSRGYQRLHIRGRPED